jgi:hypothetical protein
MSIKKLALFSTILFSLLFVSSVSAVQVFLDTPTFPSSNVYPPFLLVTVNAIGGCNGSVAGTGGKMRITQNATCTTGAYGNFYTSLTDFTWNFRYTYKTGDLLSAEWTAGGTDIQAVKFDPANSRIYLDTNGAVGSYYYTAGLGTPSIIDSRAFDNEPASMGFTDGTSHIFNITFSSVSNNITVTIDGSVVLSETSTALRTPMKVPTFFTFNPSSSYAEFDQVKIISLTATKILPVLNIEITPSNVVDISTVVTANCRPNFPDVPVALYLNGNPTTNPYNAVLTYTGTNYFDCFSNETSVYAGTHSTATVNVTAVGGGTTMTTTALTPISAVNSTEWQEAGYSWALPFLSPIFIITVIISITSGIVAKFGGIVIGGVTMLILVLLFTIGGVYPAWIGIITIILGGYALVNILQKGTTGGH